VANFRVHGIGKIHGRRAARQFQYASLWRKRINFHRREVHFQRRKELARLLQFLRPLNQLAHPGDALVVAGGHRLAIFIFPVGSHAFFGDAMHFLGADLNLKRLPGMNYVVCSDW